MGEFRVGSILVSPHGIEWEVLASRRTGSEGEGWYWMTDGDKPFTINAHVVKEWRIKSNFFEEKKNYRRGEGSVVSIWHVLDLARGPVAVGQLANGTPHMLTDFSGWREVK